MKWFVLCCVIGSTFAEPPRFKPARFRFQRQELAPTTTDSPTEPTTETESPYSGVPYPPLGWKPAGKPFALPNEKVPEDTYGAPVASGYAPSGWKPAGQPFNLPQEQPSSSYGAPDNTVTPTEATSTEAAASMQAERLAGPVEVQRSLGTYYVLLPSGELQRVEFLAESDIQNMRYSARLQLRDRAPLYVLGP